MSHSLTQEQTPKVACVAALVTALILDLMQLDRSKRCVLACYHRPTRRTRTHWPNSFPHQSAVYLPILELKHGQSATK